MASDDPLRGVLDRILRDELHVRHHAGSYEVYQLGGSNAVFGYRETTSETKVICKFYGPRFGSDRETAAFLAEQEYRGLQRLRGHGFVGSPHHVVRPLGLAPDVGGALALEYYAGEQLSAAIGRAVGDGDGAHLRHRLGALAYFLATQHNRTATDDTVDFDADVAYCTELLRHLQRRDRLSTEDADELAALREEWRGRPRMWADRQVWLHGDATPANFLFGAGIDVGVIDLERLRRGDRVFDVGRVTGELQHAFLLAGDRHRAEPFIGHFLWEYCTHFPDRQRAFAAVTARNPFYMGLNLLRIARNSWVTPEYGGRLVRQAKRLLRAP